MLYEFVEELVPMKGQRMKICREFLHQFRKEDVMDRAGKPKILRVEDAHLGDNGIIWVKAVTSLGQIVHGINDDHVLFPIDRFCMEPQK